MALVAFDKSGRKLEPGDELVSDTNGVRRWRFLKATQPNGPGHDGKIQVENPERPDEFNQFYARVLGCTVQDI